MAQEQSPSVGPDLTLGVAIAEFANGKLAGHVGDQEVLLVQSGTEVFAIAAHFHYHGPLIEGLVVGDSIRCPGITPLSICAAAKPCARRP